MLYVIPIPGTSFAFETIYVVWFVLVDFLTLLSLQMCIRDSP